MIAADHLVWMAAILSGLAAGLAVPAFAPRKTPHQPPAPEPVWTPRVNAAVWQLSQRVSGEHLRERLTLAGYFSPWAAGVYRSLQAALVCFGASAGMLAAPDEHGMAALVCVAASTLAAAALPGFWLDLQRKRRNASLSRALPYGIEFLCVALSAGSTVEDALRRAASGLRPFAPDLAGEFARLSFALGTGGAAWPSPPPALKDVSALLRQGALHGLRLIPSLRNLAQHLRAEQATRQEEAALRLGPKLTLPLILFFLPPIFLLILTPGLGALLKP